MLLKCMLGTIPRSEVNDPQQPRVRNLTAASRKPQRNSEADNGNTMLSEAYGTGSNNAKTR